jgi:hypothetical protein
VESLNVVPIYTITNARPDLARYIALPVGYRFTTDPMEVWFDSKIAAS